MKQIERIKQIISECTSSIELAGYIDGINAAAVIYCSERYPDEVYTGSHGSEVSIYGMACFLDSDAQEENKS